MELSDPEHNRIDAPVDIVSRVKELNLPLGEYAVFGSGVLEVNGIRKAKDVDIVVTKKLYKELKECGWKRHWLFRRRLTCRALKNGDAEAYTHMKWKGYREETESIIKKAELIDGVAFMRLTDYLVYKRCMPREKDKKDVELIENYFKQ